MNAIASHPNTEALVAYILEKEGSRISFADMIDEYVADYVKELPWAAEKGLAFPGADHLPAAIRKHGMPTAKELAAAIRKALD